MRSHLLYWPFVICLSIAPAATAQDVVSAANSFLQTLTPDLKKQAVFLLDDDERYNMNFVPMVRKGPTFHEFNARQRDAALRLLEVSLSQIGYTKATQIMELEKVLAKIEGEHRLSDGRMRRDPLNYHFCIFGTPSSNSVWGWRFEGHHISFNFIMRNGKIESSTPSFFGSNPAIVRDGELKGRQVLKQEMNLGFELVNSFDDAQLKSAVVSDDAPSEIITGNDRKATMPKEKGISYGELNERQKKILYDLLKVYVDNYQIGFARSLMAKIEKAGLQNLNFAWAGSLKPGSGQYYRISGPMLLIEYDNVQNNANHVHTVVRDLTNDFGEDVLREHYRKEH